MLCELCGEEFKPGDSYAPTIMLMHRECGMREVLGGIGHLTDHDYWCTQMRDPDAGLTYRESALLVATWQEIQVV